MEITVLRIEHGLAFFEGYERKDVLRVLAENPEYIAFCMHYPTMLIQSGRKLEHHTWCNFLVPDNDVVNVFVGTPEDVGNHVWPPKQSASL